MGITNKDAWERAVQLRPELVTDTGQLSTSLATGEANALAAASAMAASLMGAGPGGAAAGATTATGFVSNTLNMIGQMFIAHSAGEKIKAYTSLEAAMRPSVNPDKVVLNSFR